MKKMKRILSAAMVLLLMASLPVTAFAQEYDLVKGSIAVTAESDGKQYVSQPDNSIDHEEQTSETIIKQTDGDTTATGNKITITAEAEQTAEVTLSGVNIGTSIKDGAAVSTTGDGDVTIELDNENTIKSTQDYAGLEKNNTGELTITDEDNDDGSLYAQGGGNSAGIGGAYRSDSVKGNGSNITITGGNVTAKGGDCGAGIGGGALGKGSNIRIWGDAQVTAIGGMDNSIIEGGAAIGNGGRVGAAGESVTPDTSELTAEGSVNGASGNHVHTWDEGTVIKEPTCTEPGLTTYTCTAGNGFTKTEETPANGHTIVIDQERVEATCTKTGLTEASHCKYCDDMTVESEVLPLKEHTEVIDPAVEPTYTSTGLTEGSHCKECGTVLKEQETVPMLERTTEETPAAVTVSAASTLISPKTGDSSNLILWLALLLVSSGAVTATTIAGRKRWRAK